MAKSSSTNLVVLVRQHKYLSLLGLLLFFVTMCIAYIEYRWYQTNYSISETRINGVSNYQHEDSYTTDVINYLTGRASLPEKRRLPIYRQYVRGILEKEKMTIPENFHTLNWKEVNALAINWCKQKIPTCPRDGASLQRMLNRLFENAVRPPLKGFSPNVNDNLWYLLRKVGSPKVRWLNEQDEPASRFIVYSAGESFSFYDPTDNTIYIRYSDSVTNLLDEVGHAEQFRKKPIGSYARMGWSMLTAWIGGEFDIATAQEVYKLRYKNPSTFEGEAHGPIRERLMKESGLLIVDEKAPRKN